MDATSARLVGARVRVALRGLVAKPEYSGRVGTVLSRVGTRYKVALDRDVDSEAGAIVQNR
jgi:hypothetical protein